MPPKMASIPAGGGAPFCPGWTAGAEAGGAGGAGATAEPAALAGLWPPPGLLRGSLPPGGLALERLAAVPGAFAAWPSGLIRGEGSGGLSILTGGALAGALGRVTVPAPMAFAGGPVDVAGAAAGRAFGRGLRPKPRLAATATGTTEFCVGSPFSAASCAAAAVAAGEPLPFTGDLETPLRGGASFPIRVNVWLLLTVGAQSEVP